MNEIKLIRLNTAHVCRYKTLFLLLHYTIHVSMGITVDVVALYMVDSSSHWHSWKWLSEDLPIFIECNVYLIAINQLQNSFFNCVPFVFCRLLRCLFQYYQFFFSLTRFSSSCRFYYSFLFAYLSNYIYDYTPGMFLSVSNLNSLDNTFSILFLFLRWFWSKKNTFGFVVALNHLTLLNWSVIWINNKF